jgi:hypothetical protein
VVEGPIGIIKEVLKFRRWTVAGLDNVRTQWALVCIAFNLRKLLTPWRAGRLMFRSVGTA